MLVRSHPERLLHLPFVTTEVGLALGLSIVDGFVFEPGHVFATTQSIATQWPLIAAATAGVAFGPFVATALGLLVGPAEFGGAVANDHGSLSTGEVVSLVATSLFYGALGAVFGWQARLLKRVEGEIADRRARDEVGRIMHDTVLQTLALVERRAGGERPRAGGRRTRGRPGVAHLPVRQRSRGRADLETRVRAAVERVRRGHGTTVTVSVLDDGCRLSADHQDLVARALGEAVANALEHAAASRVVVFVETDDAGSVFASVDDDGRGFDVDAPRDSHGSRPSRSSVVSSRSAAGSTVTSGQAGTEICLWTRPTG